MLHQQWFGERSARAEDADFILYLRGRLFERRIIFKSFRIKSQHSWRSRELTCFSMMARRLHSAKIVRNWLQDCPFDVLAPWPGQSPDLNPIENCWVKLKSQVATSKQVSSYEELVDAIKSEWTMEIQPEYWEKLVLLMPRRIAACIAAGGRSVKY